MLSPPNPERRGVTLPGRLGEEGALTEAEAGGGSGPTEDPAEWREDTVSPEPRETAERKRMGTTGDKGQGRNAGGIAPVIPIGAYILRH